MGWLRWLAAPGSIPRQSSASPPWADQAPSFPRKLPVLFEPISIAGLSLASRAVMAPMMRNRAVQTHTPNALMVRYFGKRASAGHP